MRTATTRLRRLLGERRVSVLCGCLAAVGVIALTGCFVDVNDDDSHDLAPAAPRGVNSISGDGEVTVTWIENTEPDLEGYEIWRSREPNGGYVRIATVGRRSTDYLDDDVRNGTTYFYAVMAFDDDGDESPLSPETVEDTPRPEGRGVTLSDYVLDPSRAGFTFAQGDRGAIDWDRDGDDRLDRSVDVFFRWDDYLFAPLMLSDHDDLLMQDLGYHPNLTEVDVAPGEGYTFFWMELIEGHVYAFFTPDEHYAKIRVTRVSDESVTFDWAYQEQPLNTDLAPSINPIVMAEARRPRR